MPRNARMQLDARSTLVNVAKGLVKSKSKLPVDDITVSGYFLG